MKVRYQLQALAAVLSESNAIEA